MIKKYIELHGIKIICMIAAIVSVSIADASASASSHRDKPVSITEAKWESGDGRLVIKGRNAGKRGTVEIYNASSNALLDTVVADKRGKWKSEPDTAPCGVRAVSHDTSDEKMVLDAPANCDGASGDDNQPPLAVNDTAATNQNTEISINVVSNDRDTDGSIVPSTVIIVSDVTNGSIINQLNGTVTYNPNSGFMGSDAFSYTVDDNNGASSNVATVSITINAVTGSNISINSTSQNGMPVSPVTEKPAPGQTGSGD